MAPHSQPPRTLQITADGSHTVFDPLAGEAFHSRHGAVQESQHVFVQHGLLFAAAEFPQAKPLRVLEIGFGTGLNALLTLRQAHQAGLHVGYTAIEAFPLEDELAHALNYAQVPSLQGYEESFRLLHLCPWGQPVAVSPEFGLAKLHTFLAEAELPENTFHAVYFDAFSPDRQPELWTPEVFAKMKSAMVKGGVLVTYCSKGSVRRAMQEAGLEVEKLPGPPGKREMLRGRR